jgi:hypothetical protein
MDSPDGGDGSDGAGDGAHGTSPLPPFTIIALPDTQYYAATYGQIFEEQANWIVANKDALNIVMVLHEGDVVDADVAAQWDVASTSLHRLDDIVPYFITAGNHDYHNGCRDSMIDAYFPVAGFAARPSFGGTAEPGRIENNYGVVPVGGGVSWLVLALEFGPRDEILTWADGIVGQHPELPTVIVTHAYLSNDSTRFDHLTRPDQLYSPNSYPISGSINDGEQMWQKLVSKHDNIKLVLSGHALPINLFVDPDATGRLTSTRPSGSTCHQILANYQTCSAPPCALTMGGDGFLRIMRLDPVAHRLSVRTYSPFLKQWKTDDPNQFDLDF